MTTDTLKQSPVATFTFDVTRIQNSEARKNFADLKKLFLELEDAGYIRALQSRPDSKVFLDSVTKEGKDNLFAQIFALFCRSSDKDVQTLLTNYVANLFAQLGDLQTYAKGTDTLKAHTPEEAVKTIGVASQSIDEIQLFIKEKESQNANYVSDMLKQVNAQVHTVLSFEGAASALGREAKELMEQINTVMDTIAKAVEKAQKGERLRDNELKSVIFNKELLETVLSACDSEATFKAMFPNQLWTYEAIKGAVDIWNEQFQEYSDPAQILKLKEELDMSRAAKIKAGILNHEKITDITAIAKELQNHMKFLDSMLKNKNRTLQMFTRMSEEIDALLVEFAVLYHQPEALKAKLKPNPTELETAVINIVRQFNESLADPKTQDLIPGIEAITPINNIAQEIDEIKNFSGIFSAVLLHQVDTSSERMQKLEKEDAELAALMEKIERRSK